jgi:hypothetical protein
LRFSVYAKPVEPASLLLIAAERIFSGRMSEPAAKSVRWKLGLIVLIAVVMAVLTIAHVRGINGPWYWLWPWRRLGWAIYPALLVASIPFFLAQWLYARSVRIRYALLLLALGTFSLQIAAISVQPLGFPRVAAIVRNSVNTSYYDAAKVLVEQMDLGKTYRDWMEIYPDLMDVLMLHSAYKPPGLIFYYIAMIRTFGVGDPAAYAGGIGVALLAAAGVMMTYWLIRFFGGAEAEAFHGASFFAITPSLLLMFPQFDQVYPALGCLLLILWAGALRYRRRWWAFAFAVLLAVLLFISQTFLMFGVFLAIITLLYIGDARGPGVVRVIERGFWVLLTIVALYVALWYFTGFDYITTFITAARRNQAHLVTLERPWPLHTGLDFVDIALGTGWISVPLIIMGALIAWREGNWRDRRFRLVFVGLLQVFMAVAVALLPGENARLMLPMMPLLMAPIGIELARWPAWMRGVVYLVLLLMVGVIAQNMIFLYMGPEIEGVPRVS